MTAPGPPRASVVMTVYEDLRFLDAVVDSVLGQDFPHLELVVVDDGNSERAPFEALARRDPRIRVIHEPTNMGTAAAANHGIEAARSDIILRLDADDLAEPTRVGRLVAALDADPRLGLVGSAVTFIDEAGNEHGVQVMPQTDLEIRWTILFHNPFYHSAVAFRRSLFEAAGRYRVHELVSQDHYLWFDLLPLCRARNLPEPLTRYRLNPRGLTAMNAHDNPRARTHAIREATWARLGLDYPLHENDLARDVTAFLRGQRIPEPERRLPSYEVLLSVLPVFLAASRRGSGLGDAITDTAGRRRLAHRLMAHMVADPPADTAQRRRLHELCRQADRVAATTAGTRKLLGGD